MSFLCLCVASESPYYAEAESSEGADGYVYYLNVCGQLSTNECGNQQFISSCQVKNSKDVKKVAGRYQNQTLR